MLGQGKNAWQAEIDAAAEVACYDFPVMHFPNLHPLAFRLLPFRSEIRGRTLFTTAAKELTRSLEVSHRASWAVHLPFILTNAPSRVEYRALEGFVLAVSPFNFTAIGGNLPGVPALVGNVVLWKPSPTATYSNYVVYQLLEEAGVPPGVIQFVPGPPAEVVGQAISHPLFAGLHFTGSTGVFKKLWKEIAQNLDNYRSYPRIVGETGM